MNRHIFRAALLSLFCLLIVWWLIPAGQLLAQDSQESTAVTAKSVSSDQVDAHLAGMSDEQVREAYAKRLKQDAAEQHGSDSAASGKGTWQGVTAKFYGAEDKALKRLAGLFHP